MSQQQSRMLYDPATGIERPYPSHAAQWREYNGKTAWLFNPWTGERRGAGVVGDDTFGHLIVPPNEPVYADMVPRGTSGPAVIPTNNGADAFWNYWRENGEMHKHGYYESTWGAINAALRTSGVRWHDYHVPL